MPSRHKDPLALAAEYCRADGIPVGMGWEAAQEVFKALSDSIHALWIETDAGTNRFCFEDQEDKIRAVLKLIGTLHLTYITAAIIGIDVNEALRRLHVYRMGNVNKPIDEAPPYCNITDIVERTPITL